MKYYTFQHYTLNSLDDQIEIDEVNINRKTLIRMAKKWANITGVRTTNMEYSNVIQLDYMGKVGTCSVLITMVY